MACPDLRTPIGNYPNCITLQPKGLRFGYTTRVLGVPVMGQRDAVLGIPHPYRELSQLYNHNGPKGLHFGYNNGDECTRNGPKGRHFGYTQHLG